jgi:tRNA(Ile)-lysidine synthase
VNPDAQRDAVTAVHHALHDVEQDAAMVLAVSGGPDSVGMARLVMGARPDLRATVVHVRHGLRDDAHDAQVAAAHAGSLGLPSVTVQVRVQDGGTGPEDAARRARWEALVAAARDAGASLVATGHTADDQSETVLLNIARGTGLAGVAGMPARRVIPDGVTVIRPVLDLRRSVVAAAAALAGMPVASDPTNTDPGQRRSRARHDVLPRLATLTGGDTDPVVALARLARHARRDNDYLDGVAAAELDRAAGRWGPVHVVAVQVIDGAHDAVASRMVRLLVGRAQPGLRPTDAMVAAVLGLRDGQVAQLSGGLVASRGGGHLAVATSTSRPAERRLEGDALDLPELGLTLRRGSPAQGGVLPPWAPPRSAPAAPAPADGDLVVRARREGDRIQGDAGLRSVAHAMASAGVPRVARDLVPVVTDATGVLWVPGVAVRAGAAGPRHLRLVPQRAVGGVE